LEDPPEPIYILIDALLLSGWLSLNLILGVVVLIGLLVCSAMISGAEVAYFSLSKTDVEEMGESPLRIRKQAVEMLQKPKKLLATILVANNFVNVGIVILSTYLIAKKHFSRIARLYVGRFDTSWKSD
jgi:Mg2+/Co2+ transporter CorB